MRLQVGRLSVWRCEITDGRTKRSEGVWTLEIRVWSYIVLQNSQCETRVTLMNLRRIRLPYLSCFLWLYISPVSNLLLKTWGLKSPVHWYGKCLARYPITGIANCLLPRDDLVLVTMCSLDFLLFTWNHHLSVEVLVCYGINIFLYPLGN